MRFTINREQLIKGLSIAMKAVNPKPILPYLVNVKMSLTERGLELTSVDTALSIRTIIPYMINNEPVITNYRYGDTLVNCRLFADMLRRLDSQDVSLDLIDGTILKIDAGNFSSKLDTMNAEEFPDVDLSLNGAKLELPTADLLNLVDQTAFAAATKNTILSFVNLVANNHVLTAIATDTARLARKKVSVDSDVRFVANIQAKTLLEIAHSIEGAETVTIVVAEKRALFVFGNTIFSTTMANSDYPNTSSVFPKMFNYTLQVNSKELLSTLDRVSLLSSNHEGIVKMVMTEDEVELFSRNTSMGSANEKLTTFQYSGERLEVNFCSNQVIDAVRALKSEDVVISFVGILKPFVIKSPTDDSADMLIVTRQS